MYNLPNLGCRRISETAAPYRYATSNRLFNLSIGKLSWKRNNVESTCKSCEFASSDDKEALVHKNHHLNDTSLSLRRDSAATCLDMLLAAGSMRYVSVLDIQFIIPNNNRRKFLPTFHSCHISRVYTLDLRLSVGQTLSTVSLVVSLQIGVESDDSQW